MHITGAWPDLSAARAPYFLLPTSYFLQVRGLISALLALPPPPPPPATRIAAPVAGSKRLPSQTPAAKCHADRPHRRLLVCAPSNAALDEIVTYTRIYMHMHTHAQVCAPSNAALDEIVDRLVDHGVLNQVTCTCT